MRVRSTTLEQWEKLLSVPGVHFVNLQYGDSREELKKTEEHCGLKILDWEDGDPLKDLDGFAAKVAALDLLISVDNPTVHMAGALGVPVWALLPHVCDWRWLQNCEDSPWYESLRLFRQEKPREWEGVFERVLICLKECTEGGKIIDMKIKKSYRDSM